MLAGGSAFQSERRLLCALGLSDAVPPKLSLVTL